MIETEVHNINISYDDTNYHTSHFIAYLKNDNMRQKIHEYCERAKKSFDFQIDIISNRGYNFTLKYVGNNKFSLVIKPK
jgi:hypothetical protein